MNNQQIPVPTSPNTSAIGDLSNANITTQVVPAAEAANTDQTLPNTLTPTPASQLPEIQPIAVQNAIGGEATQPIAAVQNTNNILQQQNVGSASQVHGSALYSSPVLPNQEVEAPVNNIAQEEQGVSLNTASMSDLGSPQLASPKVLQPAVNQGEVLIPQASLNSGQALGNEIAAPSQAASEVVYTPLDALAAQSSNEAGDGRKDKKSGTLFKILFFVVAFVVLIGGIIIVGSKILSNLNPKPPVDDPVAPDEKVELTYWGLWEEEEVMKNAFSDFEKANPGIKVNYLKQSQTEYLARLKTSINGGSGPDLLRYHASWTPMLSSYLANIPEDVMTTSEFKQTFYKVYREQLLIGDKIYGIPLMYDGFALYFNRDYFDMAGIDVPRTWSDVKIAANKLTVPSKKSQRNDRSIERAGIALGNASNIDHFAEIVGLMMYQNGGDPHHPNSVEAREALTYYTDFYNEDKVWSSLLPNSTVAFARGEAAMAIFPSWRAQEISKMNPSLKFGFAPIPKIGAEKTTYASFWVEGVSKTSNKQKEAWKLLQFLSSSEVMKKMYSDQKLSRKFAELPSRIDLRDFIEEDYYSSSFLEDASTAHVGYINSFTHDNAINDEMVYHYLQAIEMISNNKGVDKAAEQLSNDVSKTLKKYSLQ